jgi:hypothetical protein
MRQNCSESNYSSSSLKIHNANFLLAVFQALSNEGKQRTIGILRAIEERAKYGPDN